MSKPTLNETQAKQTALPALIADAINRATDLNATLGALPAQIGSAINSNLGLCAQLANINSQLANLADLFTAQIDAEANLDRMHSAIAEAEAKLASVQDAHSEAVRHHEAELVKRNAELDAVASKIAAAQRAREVAEADAQLALAKHEQIEQSIFSMKNRFATVKG